jgi:cobalt/nickel transport system permease protein
MSSAYRELPVPPSLLSRWDARWKLAALFLLTIAFAFLESIEVSAAALGIAVVSLLLGRISPRMIAERFTLILVGVALPLVLLPFTSENGTQLAVTLALRAFAIGGVALVLLQTGAVAHTFAAAAKIGMPGVLVQVAQLAHRYAALFQKEFTYLRLALRLRGFAPRTNAHTFRTTGQAVGTLFVRGIDHSEHVAEAMRARGFDGKYHTLEPFRTTAADVCGFAATILLAIGLVVWDRLL